MNSYKKERGFTLIELLVVISIIAVLMSIMMPALSKVREQGKSVVCKSNLRQLGVAFLVYAESYDGCFPRDVDENPRVWDSILSNYMKGDLDEKNLKCPADKRTLEDGYVRSYAPNYCYYSTTKTYRDSKFFGIKNITEYFVLGERHGQVGVYSSDTIFGSADSTRAHNKNTTCFYVCGDGHIMQEKINNPEPDPRSGSVGSNWDEWSEIWWGTKYHNLHWLGE